MKKSFLFLLCVMSVSSAFAQKGEVLKTGADAVGIGVELTAEVTRKVAAAQRIKGVPLQLARITNLPGASLVYLQVPQGTAKVSEILSIRTAEGFDMYEKLVFDAETQVYIPTSLNTGNRVLYRGIRLENLDGLKNILVNGLEADKSMQLQIFFSNRLYAALGHASDLLPFRPGAVPQRPRLATLVQVKATPSLLRKMQRFAYSEYVLINENLPADKLTDIVVFLEVNGKWDWYKVIVQNGELIFLSIPNRLVDISDLFEFDFKAGRTRLYQNNQ